MCNQCVRIWSTNTGLGAVAFRRWKTSLHEAGHAVAGRVALKHTVKAAVFEPGVGAAYLGTESVPRTFEEALAVAAGPAAEALADGHAPPQASPPPPLTATHAEAVAPLVDQLRQSPRDAVALARWCIGGIENEPERWIKRFYWIRHEADLFVARHQEEIAAVASRLYERGIITLPAQDEQCVWQRICPHETATVSLLETATPCPALNSSPGRAQICLRYL